MIDNRNFIICGRCPAVYTSDQITAVHGEENTTLDVLLAPRSLSGSSRRRGGLGSLIRRPANGNTVSAPDSPDLGAIARFRDYTFLCPELHEVSGNRGRQLPIAIVGSNGSSKSHFLAALILEVRTMQTLHRLGVRIGDALYTGAGLSRQIDEVFKSHQVLATTPEGGFQGPYGYNLDIGYDPSVEYSLQLFDVSGEELGTIVKIGENASFLLVSRAIMLLIDPRNIVPTKFDSSAKPMDDIDRMLAADRSRGGIKRVAVALREVWQQADSRDLEIPIVVVIAKADSIEWDFDWSAETGRIEPTDASRPGRVTTTLRESSDRVGAAFNAVGGGSIINEVFDCFGRDHVRFVAASATSEMPSRGGTGEESAMRWISPRPAGEALALLQALDMLGAIRDPATDL